MNLSGLPDSLASFSVSRYSMAKILAIVERVPQMKDGTENFPEHVQSITLKNVMFRYDKPLFEKLNLQFQRGITVLMGESGCGKSTIVSLLMRFYDVKRGQITFEGGSESVNISNIKNDSLREGIGYVGQEPVLIGKTVTEILMAENYTEDEIYSVLEAVKADSFVKGIGLN
jgi:ABC-type multidrug transport system fused ATPase/permease subunit